MGRRARPRQAEAGNAPTAEPSLDDVRALAEAARLRLLGTPWGMYGLVRPEGRDLLVEVVRSGAILVPLATGRDGLPPERDLPCAGAAVGLAALYAAGLLATQGEDAPATIAALAADTLRQVRNVDKRRPPK